MRILIADDEKDIADALATILRYHKYECDVVYNGKDAYKLSGEQIYDAISIILASFCSHSSLVLHCCITNVVQFILKTAEYFYFSSVCLIVSGSLFQRILLNTVFNSESV